MIYTKNQQEALDYRGGNLLIIACAGSGKTQVLSRRIALLVSEGVPKESIIAFTFTDMAAGELKSRIRKELASLREEGRIDDASLGEIYIGTIHSFTFDDLKTALADKNTGSDLDCSTAPPKRDILPDVSFLLRFSLLAKVPQIGYNTHNKT